MPCLCKQCRSRSVGFWRSQLIWICTDCNQVCEFDSITLKKQSDWLKFRSGSGFLIYSAWQGLSRIYKLNKVDFLITELMLLQYTCSSWCKQPISFCTRADMAGGSFSLIFTSFKYKISGDWNRNIQYFIVSSEINVYLVKIKVVSITSEMISYHFTIVTDTIYIFTPRFGRLRFSSLFQMWILPPLQIFEHL